MRGVRWRRQMRYDRISIILLVVAMLTGCLLETDVPGVKGTWTKVYFEQGERKNADPRWSVEISFHDDGTFLWKSVSLQEKWLLHKETAERRKEVARIEKELKRNYSTSGT